MLRLRRTWFLVFNIKGKNYRPWIYIKWQPQALLVRILQKLDFYKILLSKKFLLPSDPIFIVTHPKFSIVGRGPRQCFLESLGLHCHARREAWFCVYCKSWNRRSREFYRFNFKRVEQVQLHVNFIYCAGILQVLFMILTYHSWLFFSFRVVQNSQYKSWCLGSLNAHAYVLCHTLGSKSLISLFQYTPNMWGVGTSGYFPIQWLLKEKRNTTWYAHGFWLPNVSFMEYVTVMCCMKTISSAEKWRERAVSKELSFALPW